MKNDNISIGSRIVLILDSILILAGIASSAISIPKVSNYLSYQIAYLILYAFVSVYALWGYKKPHGNMLKYLMLAYDFILITRLNIVIGMKNSLRGIILAIAMVLIGYVAGRLNKIEQNKFIIPLIGLIIGFESFEVLLVGDYPLYSILTVTAPFVIWFVISSAYFIRFKAHKEAGLAEKIK